MGVGVKGRERGARKIGEKGKIKDWSGTTEQVEE